MRLSKRLEACLQYTVGFQKLADIGTDHARIPIEAVLRGNVLTALAIDNKFGPYIKARSNIKRYHVESRVKALMGDGLSKIDNETDVVVISGLGGGLIADILSKGDRKNVKRFVLQANRNVALLRQTMMELGFKIIDEIMLEDHDILYEIVVFERGQMVLTEQEIQFGPIHLRTKPYYWVRHYTNVLEHYQQLIQRVTNEAKKLEITKTIASIKEVLDDHK